MGFGLLALGYIFLCFYTTGADLIGYIVMLFAFKKLTKVEKSFKKCMIAVAILIPVGLFNLLGFVDLAFDLGILGDYNQLPFEIISSADNPDNSDLYEQSDYSENSDNSDNSESSNISYELIESNENLASDGITSDAKDEENETKKKNVRTANAVFNALFIFGSLCLHYFFYNSANKLSQKVSVPKLGFKARINMAINIVFFSIWGFLTAGGANVALLNIVTILHFPVIILNFIYIYSCYATYAFQTETETNEDE